MRVVALEPGMVGSGRKVLVGCRLASQEKSEGM
jgi:hypothetical protein